MKLSLLLEHEQALNHLSKMSMKNAQTAWDMSESIETAQDHLKRFQTKRDELIKKIGTPEKDNPESFIIELKDRAPFNIEMGKMAEVEVKVTFPKITLEDLNGLAISPADMMGLRAMKIITKK